MLDAGLVEKVPRPDVAFGQHVLNHAAGVIGTQAGPVLSAGDSIVTEGFHKISEGGKIEVR